MPQVSLYADDALMDVLRDRSAKEHVSMSKYVAQLVRDQVMGKTDHWPANYWDDVYGCWSEEDCAAYSSPSCLDDQLDDDCAWFQEA